MSTVRDLDISKYMGEWHEIAKYPFKYQIPCDRSKAIYKWDSINNKILVENQCFKNGQMIGSRTAKAWIPDENDPGKLLIVFDPKNGLPTDPGPGDYLIHWTDYENSIVGSPDKQLLWWLSRNPTVRARDVEPMLSLIRTYGYDTEKLLANPEVVIK